jgi:hypothetical protein
MGFVQNMIDDFDGTVIGEGEGSTVRFAFQGESYELELSRSNEEKFAKLLAPYISVARKAQPTAATTAPVALVESGERRTYEPRDVRDWLQANGHKIPVRGPVKQELLRLFEEANGFAS